MAKPVELTDREQLIQAANTALSSKVPSPVVRGSREY